MYSMNLDELLKAAIKEPSKRSLFLQTLIKSDVYVICKNPVKQEIDDSDEEVPLELATIQDPEGEVFIPFFTSYHAVQQFTRGYVDCYKINCLRLFDLIQSASAVLNPNSYGKEFTSQEIKSILSIARNLKIKAINEEETVTYRPVEHSVEHLTTAASKFLSKQPNVDRAFIMEMIKGNEKPQILIVLDMVGGSTHKLFVPLSKYVSRIVKPNEHLSFISYEKEMGKTAAKIVDPFYVRQKRFFEK